MGVENTVNYGQDIIFIHPDYTNPDLTPLYNFGTGSDAILVQAGSISGLGFNTDPISGVVFASGSDTLILDLEGTTETVFALNSIATGYGDDAVIITMDGASLTQFLGNTISTGTQGDQVIIQSSSGRTSWLIPDIDTGSGHDVVDLQVELLADSGLIFFLANSNIVLGSGDDTLNFSVSTGDSAYYLYDAELNLGLS